MYVIRATGGGKSVACWSAAQLYSVRLRQSAPPCQSGLGAQEAIQRNAQRLEQRANSRRADAHAHLKGGAEILLQCPLGSRQRCCCCEQMRRQLDRFHAGNGSAAWLSRKRRHPVVHDEALLAARCQGTAEEEERERRAL